MITTKKTYNHNNSLMKEVMESYLEDNLFNDFLEDFDLVDNDLVSFIGLEVFDDPKYNDEIGFDFDAVFRDGLATPEEMVQYLFDNDMIAPEDFTEWLMEDID